MKVHYGLDKFHAKNPVVTIGTFDGVHQGHQKVIKRLCEIASRQQGESVIFTFYPHPRLIVSPEEDTLRLLTTKEEKIKQLGKLGIDHLVIFPFTLEFSKLPYAEFVEKVLVKQMNVGHLVVGYDHKFGRNRQGDFHSLQQLAERLGFKIEQLDVLLFNEFNISSTRIRRALETGDIQLANQYLGYTYTLTGEVIEGNQLGRKINFPTANIKTYDEHKLVPGQGVYAVKVLVEGEIHLGMLNIGTRPTVNHNVDHRSIEVHIFDFNQDIYKKDITLYFVRKIRDEVKFESIEKLQEQLQQDKVTALRILK